MILLTGYAETSSATEHAIHMHPAPEMSQHQTAAEAPPASKGKMKVVVMVEKRPEILTANEKVER